MILDFILMNGHGMFVWPSFLVVMFSCFILYIRTKKTLDKYEKEFLEEIKDLPEIERKIILEKSKVANQIFATNKII
jgi:heme exporter protein D